MTTIRTHLSAALLVSLPLWACADTESSELSDDVQATAESKAFANKVCLTHGYNPDADTDEPNTLRTCDPSDSNTAKYKKAASQMYTLAPPFMQKILRSLDKLYIERDPDFRFDAWSFRREGKDYMGFRAKIIEDKIEFATNFGSYDQQFFVGGRKDEIQGDLPHVVGSTGIDSLSGTLVALAGHEIGHLIQYRDPEVAASWFGLSWKGEGETVTPKNASIATMRKAFCLRSSCPQEKKVPRAEAESRYMSLAKSEFPSFFSMLNPEEDLCEAMAYHVIQRLASRVTFVMPTQGDEMDMIAKLRAPRNTVERKRQAFTQALEDSVLAEWD